MHFSLLSSNFRFSKDVFLEKLINHLKDAKQYLIKKNMPFLSRNNDSIKWEVPM